MCGFVGFICHGKLSDPMHSIKHMSDALVHRGPDDYGVWRDAKEKIFLAFRRLSILDLTEAGHQPMVSKFNRYILCFNGELYNHLEVRKKITKEFGAQLWQGTSDSETLLVSIEKYGLENSLRIFKGMFAICLYDKKYDVIKLARDRFGEKPLYYGWSNDNFIFGSDLASLKRIDNFSNAYNSEAIKYFLNYSYIPSPLSIYKDIFKVNAGEIVTIQTGNTLKVTSEYYWELEKEYLESKQNKYSNLEDGLIDLENKLNASVEMQMLADVPVGAFLSGGIDSSLITALMQRNSMQQVKTFTIGFHERSFDESPFAKDVADHIGTNHTKVDVTEKETLDLIPSISNIYTEPFADASQIPTYLLSKITKENVTVALSGDGGDELFCGYNRHLWGKKAWKNISWFPFPMRKLIGRTSLKIPRTFFDYPEKLLNFYFKKNSINFLYHKVQKLGARLVNIESEVGLYNSLTTQWSSFNNLILNKDIAATNPFLDFNIIKDLSFEENMMFWDMASYLKDDILTKVDRASMAHSLESRAPYLDVDVAKSAFKFPIEMLKRKSLGKMPLRIILEKYVPKDLTDRPKSGFGIPIGIWFRTNLTEWVESLINESVIISQGILDYQYVESLWLEHKAGSKDHTEKLWNILMLISWIEADK